MIEIAGIEFEPKDGIRYRHDYVKVAHKIKSGEWDELSTYRALILKDLWFIVYFVMGLPSEIANTLFFVNACKEVERGPKTLTLDIWAREHGKSTIITGAETIQYHMANPDKCTGIFSYARPVAKAFLRSLKGLFEGNDLLKACFPDVLYSNPEKDSPKWSEDDGLILKRKTTGRKESTIEAWGLIEGMPTSRHFDRRIYDDIETADIADSPEQLNKCFSKFEVSDNLGVMFDGVERITGTYYAHNGVLVRIKDKKTVDGEPMYHTRLKPATDDGTISGTPVLLGQERLDKLKMSEHFNSQQLCNPTPVGVRKLDSSFLMEIEPQFIPNDVYKFLVIDPAGDDSTGKGDAWAIELWGVQPKADDIGTSNVYLIDAIISPLRETEATEEIVRMYLRGGMIQQLGIEKVGLSTTEIHVANALAMKGRHVSVDNGTLVILRPAGRDKIKRIESALAWPLYNSKIFISKAVPEIYKQRFMDEMDKFPFWHDDGLDAASYLFDMLKDYHFAYYQDDFVPEYIADNPNIGY